MKRLIYLGLCICTMLSCEKKEQLTVSPSELVLYSDTKAQLEAEPSEGVTYTSDDDFYVSVTNNGYVSALRIGKTSIHASSENGSVDVPVTVLSRYSLYPELDQLINKPMSATTTLLGNKYTIGSSSSTLGTSYYYVDYNTYTKAIGVTVSGGICSGAAAFVPITYISQLTDYLTERYSFVAMQNDMYAFLNHDQDVIVALSIPDISLLEVLYMPYTGPKI